MIETKCRSWKRLERCKGGKGKEYKRDDKRVMIDIKTGMIDMKKGMNGTERMTVKSKRDKGIEEKDVRG